MSLTAYFSTEFSCDPVFGREGESDEAGSVIDESSGRESRQLKEVGMDFQHHDQAVVELVEMEFWPVEHPMEPPDEDRPVKCPMPASSTINIDGIGESSRKRSELAEMAKKAMGPGAAAGEPPVRAVRKRHHTLTRDDDHDHDHDHINMMMKPLVRMPPLPPLPTQNLTIFQMLQEFDNFNS